MILHKQVAGAIRNTNHVAHLIGDVKILCIVPNKRKRTAIAVVLEVKRIVTIGLGKDNTVFGVVVCGNAVYRFAGTDAGIVVGIADLQVSVADAA